MAISKQMAFAAVFYFGQVFVSIKLIEKTLVVRGTPCSNKIYLILKVFSLLFNPFLVNVPILYPPTNTRKPFLVFYMTGKTFYYLFFLLLEIIFLPVNLSSLFYMICNLLFHTIFSISVADFWTGKCLGG